VPQTAALLAGETGATDGSTSSKGNRCHRWHKSVRSYSGVGECVIATTLENQFFREIHKVSAMRKICLTHQISQSFSYAQNMSHPSKFTKFQLCTKYVLPIKIHKVSAMHKICLTHQNSQSFSYAQNMSHPSKSTKFQLCAKYVSHIKIHKVSAMHKICLTHQNSQSFSYAQNMSHPSKFTTK